MSGCFVLLRQRPPVSKDHNSERFGAFLNQPIALRTPYVVGMKHKCQLITFLHKLEITRGGAAERKVYFSSYPVAVNLRTHDPNGAAT